MQGGATKSFLAMMHSVMDAGHNVAVVCPDGEGVTEYLRNNGIKVYILPYIFNIRPIVNGVKDVILFLPRLLKRKIVNKNVKHRLHNLVLQIKPDIIHSNTSVNEIGYDVAKKCGIPHVTHIREYGEKDHRIHIYGVKRRVSDPEAWNIFITKDIASYYNCLDYRRSKVIYNAIKNVDNPTYISQKEDFLLYAGRIDPSKGVADLIKGYILYCRETGKGALELRIAGSYKSPAQAKLKADLSELLHKENLSDKVKWLGAITDVDKLMEKAKAVIVPSYFEGFGRVMPESQAAGALVIGRDTGGTHEQFENGREITGHEIGLRFLSVEEMASAMKKAASMTREELESYIFAAQKAIATLYSTKVSATAVLKVYQNITDSSEKKNP